MYKRDAVHFIVMNDNLTLSIVKQGENLDPWFINLKRNIHKRMYYES